MKHKIRLSQDELDRFFVRFTHQDILAYILLHKESVIPPTHGS